MCTTTSCTRTNWRSRRSPLESSAIAAALDSNTEGLSGEYIFLTDRARAVSVDVRGILEALEEVYLAERIVEELRSGGN